MGSVVGISKGEKTVTSLDMAANLSITHLYTEACDKQVKKSTYIKGMTFSI
jgi:hypothetical protein